MNELEQRPEFHRNSTSSSVGKHTSVEEVLRRSSQEMADVIDSAFIATNDLSPVSRVSQPNYQRRFGRLKYTSTFSARTEKKFPSESETRSLPEEFMPSQYRQIETPLTPRSFVSTGPILQTYHDNGDLKFEDMKRLSQLSLQMTDEGDDSKNFGRTRRQQPSRFWGREAGPKELDIGQELDDNAPIWEKYCDEARLHDKSMTDGWNSDMDMLLVFAALFSAILTAFIIEFYKELQIDNNDQMLNILADMASSVHCIANSTACSAKVFQAPLKGSRDFFIFRWIISLWFTSLALSLSVSSVAILVKQWIHAYHNGLKGQPKTFARLRQFRFTGMRRWRMANIINVLPSVMYLAVALFFAGLLLLLSHLDIIAYFLALGITIFTALIYVITTVLPIIDPSCPFRTPAAEFFNATVQIFVHYFSVFWRFMLHTWEPVLRWGTSSSIRLVRNLAYRAYNFERYAGTLLYRQLHISSFQKREKATLEHDNTGMAVNAQVIAWLSNSGEADIQEISTEALSALSCGVASRDLKGFSISPYWVASRLTETFNNLHCEPTEHTRNVHYRLSLYARSFIVAGLCESSFPLDLKNGQTVCNALQWYPALVPLGWSTASPSVPIEVIPQAIAEIREGITIMLNDELDSSPFQIVLDMLLQACLSLFNMYQHHNPIRVRISEAVLEALQVWMIGHQILDRWPRPHYLLTLCSAIQVFTGTAELSEFCDLMTTTGEDRVRYNWLFLLKNMLSVSTNVELDDKVFQEQEQSREWRLLCYALTDCSSLLSNGITLNRVLHLFSTSPLPSYDINFKYQVNCLHVIGPYLTPSDALTVVRSFKQPWSLQIGCQLCRFLQDRCENFDHANMVLESEVLTWILDYFANSRDDSAVGCICTLLKTMTKIPRPESIAIIEKKGILETINAALLMKMEKMPLELWDYYRDWNAAFKFASTCYHLSRLQDSYYVLPSRIVPTLQVLAQGISSCTELDERQESRKFIQRVIKLQMYNEEKARFRD